MAQLVEYCTGIAELMGLNPIQSLILFFRLSFRNCLSYENNCEGLSSIMIYDPEIVDFTHTSDRSYDQSTVNE